MKLTFGFSRSKSCQPLSLAIRLVEKRDYSHVYVKYQDEFTKDIMIFQASHGEVNLVSEELFLQNSEVIEEYEMSVTAEVYLAIRKEMNKLLGVKYAFLQLLNITLQKLFKSKDIRLFENGDEQFICSELGYKILKMAYPEVVAHQDSLTPSDFNKVINAIGLKRVK